MSHKTLAIFVDINDDINIVPHINNYFKYQYDDFVIISDQTDKMGTEYAIIPSIYLKFFQHSVVFLSPQTFLEKEYVLANEIFICASVDDLLSCFINKQRLRNIKLISIKNEKIEVINDAKLF